MTLLHLPVYHSVISSDALVPALSDLYEIGEITECRFLTNGLNDTYVLKTSSEKYILRIYKATWRNKQDIDFEVELLNHLFQKGIPVSRPLIRRNGEYTMALAAPEGQRFAVVFTYAEGRTSDKQESCVLYGEYVAKMHLAMNDFECSHKRFSIDLDHLLKQPVQAIRKSLSHRLGDMDELEALSKLLSSRIDASSAELEWGVCHGDLHGGNVHFHENALTHFDFDCGGFGWRAYDLCVFLWAKVRARGKDRFDNELWKVFLESYQQHKALSETDLKAIPLFVAIREIWLMGLHTGGAHVWGGGWQNDHYFDTNLRFLRDWCEVHAIH